MNLPLYSPQDDPGPNFAELVRRAGLMPPLPDGAVDTLRNGPGGLSITHGTTCVAVRYADAIQAQGDNRAAHAHRMRMCG